MDNDWINEQAEAYGMTPEQFVAWLIATGHVGQKKSFKKYLTRYQNYVILYMFNQTMEVI